MVTFLGSSLVFQASKKQNSVALSTAKAEYVAAAARCAQLLWIKQQLEDFDVFEICVSIFCDNTSAISIAKNHVYHIKAKHIQVRHHFIRDNVEKDFVELCYCKTEDQLADIFTKPIYRDTFERIRLELGMIRLTQWNHNSCPSMID